MAYLSVAGFIYFVLGLLYMDMRVDHKLLLHEPNKQSIRASFIHYEIDSFLSSNVWKYFAYINCYCNVCNG